MGVFLRTGLAVACAVSVACGPVATLSGARRAAADARRRQAVEYFIQAKAHEAQGDYLGAIVALRNAADLEPRSRTIQAQLATSYEHAGDLPMAVRCARRALARGGAQLALRERLVHWLEATGDERAAAVELEKLLRYEPSEWRHYRHLAYLYMQTGRQGRVEPLFRRLLRNGRPAPEVCADLARVLASIGRYRAAADLYRRTIARSPATEEAWLGLADLELRQGRRHAALALCRQALALSQESMAPAHRLARLIEGPADLTPLLAEEPPANLYRLGVALSEAGKYAEARLAFARIVGLQPQTAQEWLDLARYHVQTEAYAAAESLLVQAVAEMPDSTDLYLFLGAVRERQERYEAAAEAYQRGLDHHTDRAQLYLHWGLCLEQQERPAEARAVYERALAELPQQAGLHLRRGVTLAREQRWEEALASYAAAASLDTGSAEALLFSGLALQRLGRWEEAIAAHRSAVELDPSPTRALFHLAAAQEQAGRALGDSSYFGQAVASFEQLLAVDPDDAYALNYLGYMFAEAGIRLDEAVVLLERALAIEPQNGAFLDSMAWARFRRGELQQAAASIEQALARLDEDSAEPEERAVILQHAGDIARALGHCGAARTHFEAALRLSPGDAGLRARLEAVLQDCR